MISCTQHENVHRPRLKNFVLVQAQLCNGFHLQFGLVLSIKLKRIVSGLQC